MKKSMILLVITMACVGCAPQSVKKAGVMADQAIAVAQVRAVQATKAETLEAAKAATESVLKPLSDARELLVPVKLALGAPRGIVVYDPETDAAMLLAEQAAMEQRLRNLIHDKIVNLGEKLLPEQLKKLLPDPKAEDDDWKTIIQMALAAFVGSGSMYGGAKAAAKIARKKNA